MPPSGLPFDLTEFPACTPLSPSEAPQQPIFETLLHRLHLESNVVTAQALEIELALLPIGSDFLAPEDIITQQERFHQSERTRRLTQTPASNPLGLLHGGRFGECGIGQRHGSRKQKRRTGSEKQDDGTQTPSKMIAKSIPLTMNISTESARPMTQLHQVLASTTEGCKPADSVLIAAPINRTSHTRSDMSSKTLDTLKLGASMAPYSTPRDTSIDQSGSLQLSPWTEAAEHHLEYHQSTRRKKASLAPLDLRPVVDPLGTDLTGDIGTIVRSSCPGKTRCKLFGVSSKVDSHGIHWIMANSMAEMYYRKRKLTEKMNQPNSAMPPSDVEAEPLTPVSVTSSGFESGNESIDTPLTSPWPSPVKSMPRPLTASPSPTEFRYFDGGADCGDEVPKDLSGSEESFQALSTNFQAGEEDLQDSITDSSHPPKRCPPQECIEDIEDGTYGEAFSSFCPARRIVASSTDDDGRETTPLGPASLAKPPYAFPFPSQSHERGSSLRYTPSRLPSSLLRHCERNATPRQRHLMREGGQPLDRFIPVRTATPTKDALLVAPPKAPAKTYRLSNPTYEPPEDPFGPTSIRSLRMAKRYSTIRHPPAMQRPVGMLPSRVEDDRAQSTRAASAGAVWTVGRSVVTEGVASVTNGRGGRVTSGTSAPYYTAEFLSKRSPSEEGNKHGERLAVALGLDTKARMMNHPSSSGGRDKDRVWRDGRWETDDSVIRRTVHESKRKVIPIIPFRVLDAPALRDDYYCSLLAYSQTANCLAVGLGPHVYLWSESKDKADLPDSLTAPSGTAHVTSVSFSSSEGGSAILAIGRADGRITLWSPLDRDPRFDSEQPAPVSCVSFRPTVAHRASTRDPHVSVATEELLVGDELGCVYYYAVEWPDRNARDLFDWHGSMTLMARMTCHSQQICGIGWSPDGESFATGGNDNQLFLFECKKILRSPAQQNVESTSPLHVRNGSVDAQHTRTTGHGPVLAITVGQQRHTFTLNAAVKAVAFAPWQPTLIAAGGGSNDRCIHFFHTLSGATLATIDCHAQVTSLIWSSGKREIAATLGFAQPEHPYRVAVFAWPSCGMVVCIPWWGEERALFAVSYPNGPSTKHVRRQSTTTMSNAHLRQADSEGQPWYEKRTKREGCLVIATSDASIKFHEIWADTAPKHKTTNGTNGVLGGSQILEGSCSPEVEALATIR